jgi:hypothetical protein
MTDEALTLLSSWKVTDLAAFTARAPSVTENSMEKSKNPWK